MGGKWREEVEALERLGDRKSIGILTATVDEPKSVEQISEGLDMPLSTTYRKVNALERTGLLTVQQSILTEDGKIHLYRSTVTDVKVHLKPDSVSVNLAFSEELHETLERAWDNLREVS